MVKYLTKNMNENQNKINGKKDENLILELLNLQKIDRYKLGRKLFNIFYEVKKEEEKINNYFQNSCNKDLLLEFYTPKRKTDLSKVFSKIIKSKFEKLVDNENIGYIYPSNFLQFLSYMDDFGFLRTYYAQCELTLLDFNIIKSVNKIKNN